MSAKEVLGLGVLGALGVAWLIGAAVEEPAEPEPSPWIRPSQREGAVKIDLDEPKVEKLTIPKYITVKYRDTMVDVGRDNFQYQDTSKSSWIRGAWYDEEEKYMIINLNGTNYHYCGLPVSIWSNFMVATSYGTFYNASIKNKYDCRLGGVPSYPSDKALIKQPVINYQPRYYYDDSDDEPSEVTLYDECEEGDYCYAEDDLGNEVGVYVYDLDGEYGYGETDDGYDVDVYCYDCE